MMFLILLPFLLASLFVQAMPCNNYYDISLEDSFVTNAKKVAEELPGVQFEVHTLNHCKNQIFKPVKEGFFIYYKYSSYEAK